MLTRHRQLGTIAYMGGVMAIPEPFCNAWGKLCAYTQEAICGENDHIHFDRTKLSLHPAARQDLLMRMRGDWILMLDTDLSFEPDLAARLIRLFELNRLDVLCGMYPYKKHPHFPVAYIHNQGTDRHEIMADWPRDADLVPISSSGAGILMIRRGVCERIVAELHENPFDLAGRGEDHSFFTRLRRLGIQAWCAPKVEADHLEFLGLRTSHDYQPPETFDHLWSPTGPGTFDPALTRTEGAL
jgi:hypothetical protein